MAPPGGDRLPGRQIAGEILPDLLGIDATLGEQVCGHAAPLAKEPQKQVLRPDEVVAQAVRLFSRERQRAAGPVGETVEQT